FALVVTAFVAVALYEFFTMIRQRGILVHRPLCIALGVIFTGLVAWRSMVRPGHLPVSILDERATMLNWAWDIFWPATVVLIFLRQFTRRNTFEALSGLATTLFGLAYISGLLSYLFYLRTFKSQDGAWLVLFLILVTKMGDAGAFVVGRLMGRHTLMERISPRKTVEGFLGGVLVSAATAALAAPMVSRLNGSLCSGFGLGLFLGFCGQLGDLAESLIKRDCQVKDSGQLFPGLGGVLDILDSLLFTAPLFYGFLIYG
ncbi:MAG: CDP-archaeol synthase, partial [Candidatus Omnitrophica bacterium]|nr:CDP-archaeol synthase [Candidatus Omnitrophota bacterium]